MECFIGLQLSSVFITDQSANFRFWHKPAGTIIFAWNVNITDYIIVILVHKSINRSKCCSSSVIWTVKDESHWHFCRSACKSQDVFSLNLHVLTAGQSRGPFSKCKTNFPTHFTNRRPSTREIRNWLAESSPPPAPLHLREGSVISLIILLIMHSFISTSPWLPSMERDRLKKVCFHVSPCVSEASDNREQLCFLIE